MMVEWRVEVKDEYLVSQLVVAKDSMMVDLLGDLKETERELLRVELMVLKMEIQRVAWLAAVMG
jgi:hypothetical protein